MARRREPEDWSRDRASARALELEVSTELRAHPSISHVADFSEEMDAADFSFRFEGENVRLELKEKLSLSSDEVWGQWPEVPRGELMVIDETSFRRLVWAEGLGYLVVRDGPGGRWCTFGPWELCLGPRRRFERRGDRGGGEFLKGKLLLDLRTAASTTAALDLEAFLEVVRSSRTALRQVSALRLRMESDIPVIPKRGGGRSTPPRPRPTVGPASGGPTADQRQPDTLQAGGRATAAHTDPAWGGLSVDMADVLRGWGWWAPTTVQQRALPAVLAGHNVLVLGPTAGGKTEAAALPLLDRWLRRPPAAGPSILVVNPMKALLHDQLERWRTLGGIVGATAFAWHGDVSQEAKRSFKAAPTDVLLITPESLELQLSSVNTDERGLFSGLQAVVVDEVHAFVGGPRGAQLASLLERLDRFVEADLQRIGLSATVGNPQEVLEWLRGGSLREAKVVDAGPPLHGETLSLSSYVDTASAVKVIDSQLAGHRSIVFTRSRRRAEELAGELGLPTYHSSVAAEQRVAVLEQLRDGGVAAVVATSSLEVGIDVGELDLVVHDGAPNDAASYLQRLGRAGRRTGQRRLVFTTGEVDDLLLILAVVTRARRGDVGRLPMRRGARLVLGQQALAIAFQMLLADRAELRNTLRWSPVFRGLDTEIDETIDHLVEGAWLQESPGGVLVGREGQRRFGGGSLLRHLLATFTSTEGAHLFDTRGRKVGELDWSQVAEGDGPRPSVALGGRSWRVISVDRPSGRVVVEPASSGKPPSWRGPSIEVERATWEAVREVLAGTEVPLEMDERAALWLEAARLSWAPRLTVPARPTPDGVEVDTFAGVGVNRGALAMLSLKGRADGPTLEVHAPVEAVRHRALSILQTIDEALDGEAARLASTASLGLANPQLTAPSVLLAESKEYLVDAAGLQRVLTLLAEWPS